MFKKRIEMPPRVQYKKLTEVMDRTWAETLASYLKTQGIDAQLSQDAFSQVTYTSALCLVEVYVPSTQLREARKFLDDFQGNR